MPEEKFRLSEQGRRHWLDGLHENGEEALIMEVVARTGDRGITKANCLKICNELVTTLGSTDAALQALREGKAVLDWESYH